MVRHDERVRVSVVYALPDRQVVVDIEVAAGATVEAVVAQSQLAQQFPDIAARPLACAIYGRAVSNSSVVRGGDRIEILRPLLIDPKESRRQAAARNRVAARSRKT